MTVPDPFVEVGSANLSKHGQRLPGDVVVVRRQPEEGRLVCVLSDGLGSGVKANVLAALTATMAARYAGAGRDLQQGAAVIRRTLPVCSVRGISYATFTIIDVAADGSTRVLGYGNPPALWLRGGHRLPIQPEVVEAGEGPGRALTAWNGRLARGDRVIAVSDGVTQAGMGSAELPFGWGDEGLAGWLAGRRDDAAPRALAEAIVSEALRHDGGQAHDDITCAVVGLRAPRRLLMLTGPPYDLERDDELADAAREHPGRKVICGGTTAEIVARALRRRVEPDLGVLDPAVPPTARLQGFDLVTEGAITLAKALELLRGAPPPSRANGATRLTALLLEADAIDILVGCRVNEAHHDPSLPMELGLRRTLIRQISEVLIERHAKVVDVRYL